MHATKFGFHRRGGRRLGLLLLAGLALALAGLVAACGGSASDEAPDSFAASAVEAGVAATTASAPGSQQPATLTEDVADDAAPVVTATAPAAVAAADTADAPADGVTDDATAEPAQAAVRSVTVTVDARDGGSWALFSFATGAAVSGDLAESGWDLAFQRTSLLTNSGVTNAAGVGGAISLGQIAFDEATVDAGAEFLVDEVGEDDEQLNPALSDWYIYKFADHTVSPRPGVFAVRTQTGEIAIVQFASYYCDDGSAACVTFSYRMAGPAASASAVTN